MVLAFQGAMAAPSFRLPSGGVAPQQENVPNPNTSGGVIGLIDSLLTTIVDTVGIVVLSPSEGEDSNPAPPCQVDA